jgi:hypothetical protein
MSWPCGCLYVMDASLIGDKKLNKLTDLVKSYAPKSENSAAIGMEIDLGQARIECNFMRGAALTTHLQSLQDFVKNYLKEGIDAQYVIARMDSIQLAIGCLAHHAENISHTAVFDFMTRYNYELRAMLFCGGALQDYDGQCLAKLPLV